MTVTDSTAAAPASSTTGPARPSVRSIALPTEHGGWSLTIEPVLLGLIVAWSWSGLAVGVAALIAFLARTPLKVVLVDRWRHRWLERTRVAALVAGIEIVSLAVLAGVALATAEGSLWLPVLLAVPLVAVELWFDMRSRSRRLIPELCGTVGIGASVAAIVLADGGDTALAFGLWTVVAARAIAAIPYVRTQLFRFRGRPSHRWHSDLAQAVAVIAVAVAQIVGALPVAPVVAVAAVAVINVVAVRLPPRPAVVIGVQQTVFGVAVIAVTATAVLLTT